MKKPVPPCMGCTDRYIGCHAACKKYQFYLMQKEKYNNIVKSERKKESDLNDIEWLSRRKN